MTSLVTEAWQGQAARERWKSARATSLAPSPKPVSCTSGGLYPPPPSPILLLSRTYYVLAATLNVAYIINSFRPNASL